MSNPNLAIPLVLAVLASGSAAAGTVAPSFAVPEPSFGLSRETAVNTCRSSGQRDYLQALTCPDGSIPSFRRTGQAVPRTPTDAFDAQSLDVDWKLPAELPDPHLVDRYTVQCGGEVVEVYMDLYHCADPDPVRPVGALVPVADTTS